MLEPLIARMARTGVAYAHELHGCTALEIDVLERMYGSVPLVYREYLARMGHGSGRLFTHDHMAVTYEYVLDMTNELRKDLGTQASRFLPPGSLVIAGRLGEQFEFLNATKPNASDAPVSYFNIDNRKLTRSHPSVLAWLECWCTGAEEAIRRGYFERYPQGTRP